MPSIDEELRLILQMVNEWLRFAEAKNGVMLALSGTAAATILGWTISSTSMQDCWRVGLSGTALLLTVCCAVCLWSFRPHTNPAAGARKVATRRTDKDDNLYYFGHLAKYTPEELVMALGRRYHGFGADSAPGDRRQKDLAHQIVVNAGVTSRKFRSFGACVYLVLAALAFAPLFSLLCGLTCTGGGAMP